ncbi:hypothetical protein Tco_0536987 [Tanacetum coccineum]
MCASFFKAEIQISNTPSILSDTLMCKAYGGEPSVDLLRSFLNLGRVGDWLTLSSRGGADVPKALTKLQHLREISIEQLWHPTILCRKMEIKKNKSYAKLEKKCNEALQDLDKNPLVSDMRAEIETLQSQEVDSLRHDRAAVVSRVIPNAAMKLIRSDKMGVLIARLDKASIIYGRCTVFEEVAELNKPFVLEEMLGFRPSSKEEYDRAGNDLVDASYPFLAELTADPHACVE